MTRYLISFDDGAMTFPEEELPDVAEAAHAVVEEAKDAGVWVFGGRAAFPRGGERGGHRRDGHRRPVPGEQGVHRRVRGRRRALTRGGEGAGVGRQDRRRLPLRSRGPRVRPRQDRLIEGHHCQFTRPPLPNRTGTAWHRQAVPDRGRRRPSPSAKPSTGRTSSHSAWCRCAFLLRPVVAVRDNEGWSLYGAPWLQPVATGRKSNRRRSRRNKPKPLPRVAAVCRDERMVSVVSIRPPSCQRGVTSLAPQKERSICESHARRTRFRD
jgi:hypothetical protein